MHGAKATTTVACKTDQEILDGVLQAVPSHSFVFGRFLDLADALGCKWPRILFLAMRLMRCAFMTGLTPKSSDRTAAVPVESQPVGPDELKGVYATLNTHLRTLYAALPPRTALLLFSSHSDPRRMSVLNARKFAFDSAIRSGKKPEELTKDVRWTTADGRELEEVVELTKRGLLFLSIKS